MSTFAETAIVDIIYRLPTNKNKFRFPFLLQQTTEVAILR
jgi:hypothetical protein